MRLAPSSLCSCLLQTHTWSCQSFCHYKVCYWSSETCLYLYVWMVCCVQYVCMLPIMLWNSKYLSNHCNFNSLTTNAFIISLSLSLSSKLRKLKCFDQFNRIRGWLDTNYQDHNGFTVRLCSYKFTIRRFASLHRKDSRSGFYPCDVAATWHGVMQGYAMYCVT